MIGAQAIRNRYRGGRATGYEDRRSGRASWAREHMLVDSMLFDLPPGSRILDIPVGTGRYAEIYGKRGLRVVGMDVSEDMLKVAEEKAAQVGTLMKVVHGDALNIDAPDGAFDAAVCTRLVNWFLPAEMAQVVSELTRVTKNKIILSIELGPRASDVGNNPHNPKVFDKAVAAAGAREERRDLISPGYWMIQLGKPA